jgi:hypothetical protein
MENTRLIHEYLDGELEQTQQDNLFRELANNTEMRNEFNSQLKIHSIVRNDIGTINAPIATTNAIFGQLGFQIPPTDYRPEPGLAAGLVRNAGTWGAALMMMLRKYSPYLMSAVLSAGLTALLVYFIFDKFGGEKVIINGNSNVPAVKSFEGSLYSTGTTLPSNGISQAEMKRIIDESLKNYISKFEADYNKNMRNLAINNQNQNNNTQPNLSFEQRDNLLANNLSVRRNSDLIGFRPSVNVNQNSLNGPNSEYNNTIAYIPLRNDYNTKFILSLRGITSQGNPNVTVPTNSNAWFTNIGFGASYNVSDFHAFGLEAGREAYPQVFTKVLYGDKTEVDQNPTYFWYGATYKLSLSEFFVPKIFYPYAQIFGGATTVGPLARAMVGLQYRPDKRVTFNLGAEASILYYNFQGTLYDSRKYGLTYGVSINY